MLHHFGSVHQDVTFELKKKKGVKFVNHDLVTIEDDVAKQIEASDMFKNGELYRVDSSIVGANKRTGPRVVSGARGTDDNDSISLLQKELAEAKAKIVELEKAK